VEFVDCRESMTLLIATSSSHLADNTYTHCELHPSLIFGFMVAGMPFPENNQSPRNVYYAAMGKQSVGVSALNERMDSLAYALHYPQRPLVASKAERIAGFEDICGHNAVVAIMTYMGYNQEDSVILNQSSIDRGFGHSSTYHTYRAEERSMNGAQGERMCNPDTEHGVQRKKMQAYGNLDVDGLVSPGTRVVAHEDVLIGKVVPAVVDGESRLIDASVVARCDGIVDRVVLSTNGDGRLIAKVRVRSTRAPEVGDKFASRHGQKGVCGMKYRQEDMPWNLDGITPDLIMNPHAIPSRMTIGHMKEALLAKVAAVRGECGDGTAFGTQSVESMCEELHALGYQRHGCEVLYSGSTGQRLGHAVFMGPGPFYQVLKHQVRDKLHSRSRGPTQAVTRQPSAGRSRDGALRLGEMERDCLISHGTSALLLERLLYSSDVSEAPVCRRCGFLGVLNEAKGINHCRSCKGTECVEQTRIPHPTKALIQELYSVGIDLRLELDSSIR
jgi:DNA-directed RNA polymerase II subunit RPB2